MPKTTILNHSAGETDAECDKGSGIKCLVGPAELWAKVLAQLRSTDLQGHSQEPQTAGRVTRGQELATSQDKFWS